MGDLTDDIGEALKWWDLSEDVRELLTEAQLEIIQLRDSLRWHRYKDEEYPCR